MATPSTSPSTTSSRPVSSEWRPQMPTTPQRSGSPGSGPASLTVSAMRTRTTLQVASSKDPDQALTYLHRVCSLASPKSLRERSATAVCSSQIPCGTSTSSSIEALTWSCSCSAGGTVGCRPS